MESEKYTIAQAQQAHCNLEPLICSNCGHIGEVTYNSLLNAYHCGVCGEWVGEKGVMND